MQANFEEFVVARGRALIRFAYLLTGDGYLAEDLVQEALLRSHRRWSAVERTDNPEPYVRKAILHLYLSWRSRRSSSEAPFAELPDRPGPDQPTDAVVERDELWLLLRQLPRAQRAVVVLRYYEDLSDADIAALLGCSRATVRVHAFKALAKLRTALTRSPAVTAGVRHE
ncbi:SigE family RNA polymerase sigma factor [Micromonospora sonneratiae]|jgi:RNA polymerase sigma-70 factor (sigma-E family)